MEETSKDSWLNDAVKKGLVLGIIHILVLLVLYYAIPNKLTGFSYVLFILALNIGYTIYNGRQLRAELGGYMDFGSAFKYTFVILAVNGLVGLVFSVIFLLVEPAFPQVMAQSQLDTSLYWASKMGAPEASLDEMRDKFDMEEIEKRFSFSGLLLSFGIGLIFYALGALISSLFVKKNQPEVF